MKKIYSVLFFSAIALAANAQTITRQNLPFAGDTYSSTFVSSEDGNWNAGGSGDLQTWDFSDFTGDVVPYTYVTANSSVYPSAQFKLGLDNLGDSYFKGSESDYRLVGVASKIDGFTIDVPYRNEQILFKFPMMYLDNFKDTAYSEHSSQITYLNFPITVLTKRTTHSETTVDGRGTLKLANKTFENVLRVKVYAAIYDTATGPFNYKEIISSSTEEYYFFSQDYKNQLAYFMRVISDAQPEPIQFIFTFNDPVVLSTNSAVFEKEQALVYPNPASSSVNVNMQDAVSIEIFDMKGNTTLSSKLNGGLSNLDISTLKTGVYNYRVMLKSGETKNGKLTIQ